MLTWLDPLWERLLRGGVGRRHARRYITELRDHLDDLVAEERRAGRGARDPEARALARLGSVEALAGAMIARRELRAWSAKAPVATYLIAPSLALAVCIAVAMATVVLMCVWLRAAGGVPTYLPAWSRALTAGVMIFSNAALSVLLGWALVAMAVRQRSSPLWPVLGIVILAVVGAAVQVDLTLPSMTGRGEIELAPSFGSFAQWAGFGGRLALNLILTLTPYASLSLLRSAQAQKVGAA